MDVTKRNKKDKHKGMVVIQNLAGKNKYDIDQTGDIPK